LVFSKEGRVEMGKGKRGSGTGVEDQLQSPVDLKFAEGDLPEEKKGVQGKRYQKELQVGGPILSKNKKNMGNSGAKKKGGRKVRAG